MSATGALCRQSPRAQASKARLRCGTQQTVDSPPTYERARRSARSSSRTASALIAPDPGRPCGLLVARRSLSLLNADAIAALLIALLSRGNRVPSLRPPLLADLLIGLSMLPARFERVLRDHRTFTQQSTRVLSVQAVLRLRHQEVIVAAAKHSAYPFGGQSRRDSIPGLGGSSGDGAPSVEHLQGCALGRDATEEQSLRRGVQEAETTHRVPQELFAANAHQKHFELSQAVELCRADGRTSSTEPAETGRDVCFHRDGIDPEPAHQFTQPRTILFDVLDQLRDRRPRRLVRLRISSAPCDVDRRNRPCEVITQVCRKPCLKLPRAAHRIRGSSVSDEGHLAGAR